MNSGSRTMAAASAAITAASLGAAALRQPLLLRQPGRAASRVRAPPAFQFLSREFHFALRRVPVSPGVSAVASSRLCGRVRAVAPESAMAAAAAVVVTGSSAAALSRSTGLLATTGLLMPVRAASTRRVAGSYRRVGHGGSKGGVPDRLSHFKRHNNKFVAIMRRNQKLRVRDLERNRVLEVRKARREGKPVPPRKKKPHFKVERAGGRKSKLASGGRTVWTTRSAGEGVNGPSAAAKWKETKLRPELVAALRELDFPAPTQIQALVVPCINRGQNVLFCAETGSGKTLAYLLPLIHRLRAEGVEQGLVARERRPRALVVVPTRELAEQVFRVATSLARHAPFRAVMLCGGERMRGQRHQLASAPDLVVCTPGRLLQLRNSNDVYFSEVGHLVIDEADTMFDFSFRELVMSIIAPLTNREGSAGRDSVAKPQSPQKPRKAGGVPGFTARRNAQVVLVTATVSQEMLTWVKRDLPDMRVMKSGSIHKSLPNLLQRFVKTTGPDGKRLEFLDIVSQLADTGKRALIFCNDAPRVEEAAALVNAIMLDRRKARKKYESLAELKLPKQRLFRLSAEARSAIDKHGLEIVPEGKWLEATEEGMEQAVLAEANRGYGKLHAEMLGGERVRQLRLFQDQVVDFMVCTDILGRGIDPVNVDHVILYNFPTSTTSYLHRVGRVGRAGRVGHVHALLQRRDLSLAHEIRESTSKGEELKGLSDRVEKLKWVPTDQYAKKKVGARGSNPYKLPSRAAADRRLDAFRDLQAKQAREEAVKEQFLIP